MTMERLKKYHYGMETLQIVSVIAWFVKGTNCLIKNRNVVAWASRPVERTGKMPELRTAIQWFDPLVRRGQSTSRRLILLPQLYFKRTAVR